MFSHNSPCVDFICSCFPNRWVANHYKWIVWKLASYERCYPAKFSGKLLTISNVLEELKYRYKVPYLLMH